METGYMLLQDCLNNDWFWIGILVTFSIINAVGYVLVAYEAGKEYGKLKEKTPAANGFFYLMIVFVLCGITGYLINVLGLFTEYFKIIQAIALIPLSLMTWTLIYYLKSAKTLQIIFNAEAKLKEYHKTWKA